MYFTFWKQLTDAVQAVKCHSLKRPPHHGVFLQHLVEVVHRQRVQPAVVIRPHAGCPPASSQQADFCKQRIKSESSNVCSTSLSDFLQGLRKALTAGIKKEGRYYEALYNNFLLLMQDVRGTTTVFMSF